MQNLKFNNMKILFICSTDNMIWQFLTPHIKDLLSFGASVDCVCSKTGFWFDSLKEIGFNMIELDLKRAPINMTNYRGYKFLKKLQRENKYNLIYCQQPTGGLMGRFVGKKFKIPVIYIAHGFFFFKGNNPIKNFIYYSAEKYMAKFTDILITMNEEDYLASKKFKAKKKYKISGIGLNEDKYQFEKQNNLPAELMLKDDNKIILSVSEFIPRKNYKTMLKTFAALARKRDDVKYILCGSGRQFEEMKVFAKKLDIQDKVLFLGYRTDIGHIMQISDIFFHQSFHEGLTMSIMEAMHFSLPVVASRVRGNKDLIDEGVGGFLTEPKNVNAQLKALEILLDDKKMREEFGKNNHEKVKDYCLNSVREELKEIYQENGFFE